MVDLIFFLIYLHHNQQKLANPMPYKNLFSPLRMCHWHFTNSTPKTTSVYTSTFP